MKKFAIMIAAMLVMAPFSLQASNPAGDDEASNSIEVSHPFKTDSTTHWTVETGGFYVGLGVKHNWEAINNSFEIGLLNFASVNYNSLHGQNISLGVGIHHHSYSMKRPGMLVRDYAGDCVELSTYPFNEENKAKRRSSNLNIWSVQFPLIFSQKIVKKLNLSVGGILNWNTYARIDNRYEIDKTEFNTRFKGLKQNKVNFDIMGALTWNQTGIYCRYSPGKFFKDGHGPEIKNTWTLGLTIGL